METENCKPETNFVAHGKFEKLRLINFILEVTKKNIIAIKLKKRLNFSGHRRC